MYIHGGRDLKEGPLSSLWRINLTNVTQLQQGGNRNVGWEHVSMKPKNDIGKISHHKCAMISANEVAFFGGNRAEGQNNMCHVLDLLTNAWNVLPMNSAEIQPESLTRDDHNAVQHK